MHMFGEEKMTEERDEEIKGVIHESWLLEKEKKNLNS